MAARFLAVGRETPIASAGSHLNDASAALHVREAAVVERHRGAFGDRHQRICVPQSVPKVPEETAKGAGEAGSQQHIWSSRGDRRRDIRLCPIYVRN